MLEAQAKGARHAVNKAYTVGEEIANAITHGIGVPLSIAALVVMIVYASYVDAWLVAGVTVFGLSMFITYLASTIYHAIPHPHLKRPLRIFDHCAIYLLIAGTYTPFLLFSMRSFWGWMLFGIVWTAAVCGIVFKLFFTDRWDKVSTFCYVAMGWVVLLALKPAIDMIPPAALALLAAGGLLYTGGVIFYLWDRLPYNHAIWHLFVLGGTLMHFFAVFAVMPA